MVCFLFPKIKSALNKSALVLCLFRKMKKETKEHLISCRTEGEPSCSDQWKTGMQWCVGYEQFSPQPEMVLLSCAVAVLPPCVPVAPEACLGSATPPPVAHAAGPPCPLSPQADAQTRPCAVRTPYSAPHTRTAPLVGLLPPSAHIHTQGYSETGTRPHF